MPPRDVHLRGRQFLATKAHPTIRIQADSVRIDDDGGLRIDTVVTARETPTRVELRGHRHDEPGVIALHVHGALDRTALGITPPAPFAWVVGREITLDALLVFVR